MQKLVKDELEVKDTSVQDINFKFRNSIHSHTDRSKSNLKEQLEELMGRPADFKSSLEKVNLSIGIIISGMLLLFFFI